MIFDSEGKPKIVSNGGWGPYMDPDFIDSVDDHLLAHISHFPIAGYSLGEVAGTLTEELSVHFGGSRLGELDSIAYCWDADRSGSPWFNDEALAIRGITKAEVEDRVALKKFYREELRKEREAEEREAQLEWELSVERARQIAEIEEERGR